ncbi:MAG: transcription-repair coupling factor [Blastocatellia bacterium]|nr:transcription-repair coupling factor [Blastocatellia bacterium]
MGRYEENARDELRRRLRADPALRALREGIARGEPVLAVSDVHASGAKAFFLAALRWFLSGDARPLVFVGIEEDLQALGEEVRLFLSVLSEDASSTVVLLPALDVSPFDGLSPHPAVLQQRAHALTMLAQGEAAIVLVEAKALMMRTFPPEDLRRLDLRLAPGEEIAPETLVSALLTAGYVREDPVREPGQFSWRGGILDVYSPSESTPVRIEFFGDEVASLRAFDPESQRSIASLDHTRIIPLREFAVSREELQRWNERLAREWAEPQFAHDRKRVQIAAQTGDLPPGWEFLIPLTRPLTHTLFEWLPSAFFLVDDAVRVPTYVEQLWQAMMEHYDAARENGRIVLPPEHYFLTPMELTARLTARQRIELHPLGRSPLLTEAEDGLPPVIEFRAVSERGARTPTIEWTKVLTPQPGALTFLIARSKSLAEHFLKLFTEHDVPVDMFPSTSGPAIAPGDHLPRWPLFILVGHLRSGFHLPALGVSVFSQHDLLREEPEAARPSPSRERPSAAFLSDFKDLKPGDYLVHVDHGIGQFEGLVQLRTPEGTPHDFLLLRYADDARLYVPVERLDLVQKYVGADGGPPRLDRLGGTTWLRTKARAVRAMRDLAEELLKLYAERKLIPGHAFSPDTPWQAEFEASFEYELTPDQARALEEIKRDMERPVPMDRLLCGDVGFGKTEVAMRAAFKAVMDGKQVAVLAPTTVLVEQHYRTFTRRFAAFPITIAQLSRFCSRAEIARTLRGLEEGTVDIVIGTHRLLGRDVRFRDLGLVIIDEEQRFGVQHKEQLKQLRRRVDVLTLTATPIPRTLYMALTGLRDLSVIQTPPPDRLAVQTAIVPFSSAIIRSAIERELQRGGQVFFVHNDIETIHEIAHLIRQLVPHARVGVAHGRLSERELERTVLRFVRQELDVLVTTTIIENGIDIPQANTILINMAERFGLADLYQLRGRVGRSNRLAYAYLLIPPEATLSSVARRRLAALKEFSDLGSGFRLAALDLELRGAGNLLGPEQSGHLNALGFELYCQLLERAIRELRGEKIEEEIVPQINLRLPIRIPETYIADMSQRLHVYKRLAAARTEAKLAELREELVDRYGPLPPEVERLLLLGSIRNAALSLRVRAIEREGSRILIQFADPDRLSPECCRTFLAAHPSAEFTPEGTLRYDLSAPDERTLLLQLRDDLLQLQEATYNSPSQREGSAASADTTKGERKH